MKMFASALDVEEALLRQTNKQTSWCCFSDFDSHENEFDINYSTMKPLTRNHFFPFPTVSIIDDSNLHNMQPIHVDNILLINLLFL